MNPEISELFGEILQLEEELEGYEKYYDEPFAHSIEIAQFGIKWRKEAINEISFTLNPQVPEPYASMSRDEILGGIGQYARF